MNEQIEREIEQLHELGEEIKHFSQEITRLSAVMQTARAELEALALAIKWICDGCGSRATDCAKWRKAGAVACCPDCTHVMRDVVAHTSTNT